MCCSTDLHFQTSPILIITSSRPPTDKKHKPPQCTALSTNVCMFLSRSMCVFVFARVCVRVGWCEGKNPSLWFTHHSVWPAEILSFSGRIAFFFFFFCPWRFFFLRQGKPNGSHSHALFLLERKSEWLMLFFRKQHQRKTHEVKMSPTILFFLFF